MLVSEIKDAIKGYDKKQLEKIIIELYKRIPKNKKEEYGIDDFIKQGEVQKKTDNILLSFDELTNEVESFLSYVDAGYYSGPNRFVPRKERSQWRFRARRYYKSLMAIEPNSEDGVVATHLLIELFKRLSIGCYSLRFSNWDTFRALGVPQCQYYEHILKRVFTWGYSEKNLQTGMSLLNLPRDVDSLTSDMYDTFISNLPDNAERVTVIKLFEERLGELKAKKPKNSHEEFDINQEMNEISKCVLKNYIYLGDVDKGIKFFHKYNKERSAEVKEYILLNILERFDLKDEWIKEYESKKLDYRDNLKEKYKQFKETI